MGPGSTLAGTPDDSSSAPSRNNTRRICDADIVLYRPQDLLFLRIGFVNFEIQKDKKLHRKSGGTGYTIISFQSQSIAETAYPEAQPLLYRSTTGGYFKTGADHTKYAGR